jgi:membrane-bound lytic murein transglycosylase D
MRLHRLLVVLTFGVSLVGCGAHTRPQLAPDPLAPLPVTAISPATSGTVVQLQPDPVAAIIVRVETEFEAGRRELAAGRLVAARTHFDAAVDVLLSEPQGARATPRLAAEFDQLLDRISALDLLALREADGFTELRSEPAAIDELLAAAMFEAPKAAATTRETVVADLARGDYNIPIPANEQVLSFVELFQGRLHDFMQASLDRSLRYLPMIQRAFLADGLPSDLAYVPLVESAFKVNALSRVKARGLWQFMPGTGRENGLDQTWFVDERSDPEKATHAAASYLKSLNKMFDGDWNLALASYNAGPGRLQTAIRRAKTADYWSLSSSSRFLPRETREYVPMIMAATIIAKNPTLYGFTVGTADPLSYERVTVPNALDLKIIAEWISCSVEDLRELNPELRRTTTPMGDHELKVPLGTAATLSAKLAAVDPSLYVHFNFYTVKRGDTIATIARKYKVSQNDLRLANELSARAKVRANQTLMIPQRPATGLPASPAARTVNASASPVRPATTVARASTANGPVIYRVKSGDTLYRIARQFDTTVDYLRRLNHLSNDQITVGERLTVRQ